MSAPSSPIRLPISSPSHSERTFLDVNRSFSHTASKHSRSGDLLSEDVYANRHLSSGNNHAPREFYGNRPAENEHISRFSHMNAGYIHSSAISARDSNYNTGASAEHLQHAENSYRVATNRSGSYNSGDALHVSATASGSRWDDSSPGWPSKHGSLEGAYRRQVSNDSSRNLSSGCLMNSRFNDIVERTFDTFPRPFACIPVHYETPPHLRTVVDTSCESIELSPSIASDGSTVVTRGQNYVEISKPFEMADVYKYSSRLRRTGGSSSENTNCDMRSTSSPQLSAKDQQHLLSQSSVSQNVPWSQQYNLSSQRGEKPVFK